MAIENDIKQYKFKNQWQKAMVNLIYTASWVSDHSKFFFDNYDITPQQFNVLRILRGSMPLPISTVEIKKRMLEKQSDASRIVDRLVLKKLVVKKNSKEDKRQLDIFITAKGLNLLSAIDEKMSEVDAILSNISEQDAVLLNEILDRIRG